MKPRLGILLLVFVCGCEARASGETTNPASQTKAEAMSIAFDDPFPKLRFERPVWMFEAQGHFYVLEQDGRILRFAKNAPTKTELVLDISARTNRNHGESGLLGAALHPNFPEDRRIFVSYVTGRGRTFISRLSSFNLDPSGASAGGASEKVLLEVEQPFGNHNGGHLLFGPDGYLYWGLGDGGAAGDPYGHGQNTQSLLGSILRIDVSGTSRPYEIPADNSFASKPAQGRLEIFAWGLRNPWRFSFDRRTGKLWVGDVGQNKWEEVTVVEPGTNHGWKIREADTCYRAKTCRTEGLVEPVAVYGHREGQSITGGYVYRGAQAELQGQYIYADFASGRFWALEADLAGAQPVVVADSRLRPSSFAEDREGELYVLDYPKGAIFRVRAR